MADAPISYPVTAWRLPTTKIWIVRDAADKTIATVPTKRYSVEVQEKIAIAIADALNFYGRHEHA